MAIKAKYDFVLLFDVTDGNPNGDPDAGNMPRVDPETMQGMVTDGSLKRKVRDYVAVAHDGTPGMEIFVKHRGILNNEIDRAFSAVDANAEATGAKPEATVARRDDARRFMCKTFYDVRTFGAVMSTGNNAGQVRGPVQLTMARSIDPIVPLDLSITRVAFTKPEDAKPDSPGTMGRKHSVPYGLYRAHGFVSPTLASQTGFSDEDLAIFWRALQQMFEFDRSAARGMMSTRELCVFEHTSPLGNAPAHKLFDAVTIARKDDARPPRAFSDYVVSVDRQAIPEGVKLIR